MTVLLKPPEVQPRPLEEQPDLMVALPRQGLPGAVIAALGLLAAVLLFLFLDAQRRRASEPVVGDAPATAFAPPPPLALPPQAVPETTAASPVVAVPVTPVPPPVRPQAAPTPPPQPQPAPAPVMRPLPPPRPLPPQPRQSRLAEPALIVDASASQLPVGTLIPAVLETPIDTSRPGLARALVSRDSMSSDGQHVLIPRGSRLIGEYGADVRSGQNRVLVNWTSLIQPNGVTLRLSSPAADATGGAGIPGRVNGFFLSNFFNSALQTALTVGGNLVGRSGGNTVVVGLPAATAGVDQTLTVSSGSNRRKITVKPGTVFNVFVAREIDFSGADAAQPAMPPAPTMARP